MDKLQTMAESDMPTKYTALQTMTPVVTEAHYSTDERRST